MASIGELAPQAPVTVEAHDALVESGTVMQRFAGHVGAGIRSGYESALELPQNMSMKAKVLGASVLAAIAFTNAEAAIANPDSVASKNAPGLAGAASLPGAPEVGSSIGEITSLAAAKPAKANTGNVQWLANSTTLTMSSESGPSSAGGTTVSMASESRHAKAKATASTGEDLEAICAEDILKMPDILQARLYNAGKPDQLLLFKVHFGPVDPRCNGKYTREAAGDPQLEDGKNSNHFVHMFHRLRYQPLYSSGNESGVGGRQVSSTGHYDPNLDYDHGEEVKMTVRIREKDQQTGEIVGQRVKTYPIQALFSKKKRKH